MSSFKTDQRHVTYRGRDFHFVSYDAEPSNERMGREATPASWFLINAGKRWLVMPHIPGQQEAALEMALHDWLDVHVFGETLPLPPLARRAQGE